MERKERDGGPLQIFGLVVRHTALAEQRMLGRRWLLSVAGCYPPRVVQQWSKLLWHVDVGLQPSGRFCCVAVCVSILLPFVRSHDNPAPICPEGLCTEVKRDPAAAQLRRSSFSCEFGPRKLELQQRPWMQDIQLASWSATSLEQSALSAPTAKSHLEFHCNCMVASAVLAY